MTIDKALRVQAREHGQARERPTYSRPILQSVKHECKGRTGGEKLVAFWKVRPQPSLEVYKFFHDR